ncbi:MAG: hypothetical protein KGL04_11190, partial [Elusimicrobia bacterium]|nr:hypothetical protein [Elusimicrobiota bacterium]
MDFFRIWPKFESVSIFASLDATGERGEYIREGQNWAQAVSNRELMLRACPQVRFAVTPTLSILNALHLPDFHREWVGKGYVSVDEFVINNILSSPRHYRACLLPIALKRRALAAYQSYTDEVAERHGEAS